jgi:hypothetical protein
LIRTSSWRPRRRRDRESQYLSTSTLLHHP